MARRTRVSRSDEDSIVIPSSWSDIVALYKSARANGDSLSKGITPITKLINISSRQLPSYRDVNHCLIMIHSSSVNPSGENKEDNRLCDHHRVAMSEEVFRNHFVIPQTYRKDVDLETGDIRHVFEGESRFCSFSCMLYVLLDSRRYGEHEYKLATEMWSIISNGEPMPLPARRHGLLKQNGGTMDISQYMSDSNIILDGSISVGNVSMISGGHHFCTSATR